MSRYEQFLSARRAQRRKEAKRNATRGAALLLTLAVGAAGGWWVRGWSDGYGGMRRPETPAVPPETVEQPLESTVLPPAPPSQSKAETAGDPTDRPPPSQEETPDRQEPEAPLTGSLQQRLVTLSRTAPGTNSVWFYDLTTNEALAVKGDKLYTAASTAKVPIVMYLYHLAANNKLSLEQKVRLEKDDWAPGTGVLQAAAEGRTYTLRELARLALVHSDNIATNMLIRTLGNDQIAAYLREIGVRHDRGENLISPQSLGLAFRHLWRMARRYPNPWEEPLAALRATVFNDRLPAGVPDGVPVAHKIGSVDLAFHDAGIVYHKRRPYILVVMTDGMGEQAARRYIGRVSREVWRWQDAAP